MALRWALFLIAEVCCLPIDRSATLSRIAFGSCFGQFGVRNENIFRSLVDFEPQLFVWSGDVAYIDFLQFPFQSRYATLSEWLFKLNETKSDPGYSLLRAHSMIAGTWDDHDSGMDDGDMTNQHLPLAKSLFLDFIDEPANSARRQRDGLYDSLLFGSGSQTVKVILLDVRTFREPWNYTYWNYDGDSLGPAQWSWLERELQSPGALTVLISGTFHTGLQVFVEDKYGVVDRWHPKSAERLARLIGEVKGTVVVISGDVHQAEMIHYTCLGKDVVEVTSSGLTHSVESQWGFLGVFYNYILVPFSWNSSPRFLNRNFGTIVIDWKQPPSITIDFRNEHGDVVHAEKIRILDAVPSVSPSHLCSQQPRERFLKHVTAAVCVFVLPGVMLVGSLVVFARKYSHSY